MFGPAGILSGIDMRDAAPRFSGKTIDGGRFDNQSLLGQVVLIQFWTTWCPVCRRDQEAVDNLVNDFAGKGLVVLAVNVGEARKKVRRYLEDSPRSCRIVLTEDTNLSAVFAARSYPLYVLIDRDGKLATTQTGSGGEASLRRMLEKAGLRAD